MRRFFACFMLLLFFAGVSQAADTSGQTGSASQVGGGIPTQAPAEPASTQPFVGTPVGLEHTGTDSLGVQLALDFKSALNANSLFGLKEGDGPKLKVLIFTQPEFPSRPGVGSIYSAIWLYSESSKVFPTYLDSLQGVLTAENKGDVVTGLVQKTDAIATKYAYIFK